MKFRLALAFFSRLPIKNDNMPHSFDGILAYFPLVGCIIGLIVACIMALASFVFSPSLSGLIACVAWVFLTGGLHLDGVSDCGDGLVVEASPERRLEIMKDSCVGTFGSIALFLVLITKILALQEIIQYYPIRDNIYNFLQICIICASAGGISRAMNFVALRLPSARAGGLGDLMRNGLTLKDYQMVYALAIFLCCINGLRGILIALFVGIFTYALLNAAKKRIHGITGDVLGCTTEITEIAVLLACCASFGI